MAIAKRITLLARRLDDLAAKALAPHGLERAEFDVLVTLLRSGPAHETTPTRLNHYLQLSSGGLTKRLTRLERRALVTRRMDPVDRRSLLVALTAEGKALTEAAVNAHTCAVAGLVAPLPDADREQLAALLRAVLAGGEPTTGSRPHFVTDLTASDDGPEARGGLSVGKPPPA
jgi:DNA-binding MarR family transcriptional regulator